MAQLRRKTRQPTASSATLQPGGTTVVEPPSSTSAGPCTASTGRQPVAVEDRHAAAPCRRRSRRGVPRDGRLQRSSGRDRSAAAAACPTVPMPRGDSSRSRSRASVVRSIARRIDLAEGALDRRHAADIERDRHRQLEGLADVAHVEAGGEARRSRRSPRRRARLRRRAASPASADRTSAMTVLAVAETRVRTKSRRTSAMSRPSAEKLPGSGGTTTVRMPSSSATAAACSGPAPPNGKQREVARIDAAHHRHFLDGAGERNGGDAQDALRHRHGTDADRAWPSPGDGSVRRRRGRARSRRRAAGRRRGARAPRWRP